MVAVSSCLFNFYLHNKYDCYTVLLVCLTEIWQNAGSADSRNFDSELLVVAPVII
jgi:hypothetical protein